MMHPTVFEELEANDRLRERRWLIKKIFRIMSRILFSPVFTLRPRAHLRIEDAPPLRRFVRGMLYRLAFVPILLVIAISTIVYANTHPPAFASSLNPSSLGLYFEPINYVSQDGLKLEGWIVPVIDAQMVLNERERALRRKQPAVVLVHDYAASREQMLPLVKPLHEHGFVVLIAGLRGIGDGIPVGETFGLNESFDVNAAVDVLRVQPFVAADRIALLGTGSGASAATLAARRDHAIATVIVHRPVGAAEELTHEIGPVQSWLGWMRPLCKWSFELAYRVDAEDLDVSAALSGHDSRPVLRLDPIDHTTALLSRKTISQISQYLDHNIVARKPAVANVSIHE